jgi:hypothetical protein
VYMREGTTSRLMAADRRYGEFYDFYSISPEYFGYLVVYGWEWVSRLTTLLTVLRAGMVCGRYKLDGPGFESRLGQETFSCLTPSWHPPGTSRIQLLPGFISRDNGGRCVKLLPISIIQLTIHTHHYPPAAFNYKDQRTETRLPFEKRCSFVKRRTLDTKVFLLIFVIKNLSLWCHNIVFLHPQTPRQRFL